MYYLVEPILFDKIRNSKIKELVDLLNKFETVLVSEIPVITLNNVKNKDLNPLVGGIRLNDLLKDEAKMSE